MHAINRVLHSAARGYGSVVLATATVLLILLLVTPRAARGAEITVTNKCPAVTVSNKTAKCSYCGNCACRDGDCPSRCPAVVKEVPAAFRSPHGHTHTCRACGNTWDHDANPTHNCLVCGQPQYVQDVVPRAVPVPGVKYTMSATSSWSQSGCANGKCSLPTRR